MRTSIDGPVILYGNDNPQQNSNTDAGPNVDFQSNALLDSRFASLVAAAGEGAQGGVLSFHNPVEVEIYSSVPQAASNTLITTSQTPAALAFFALASANAVGLAVNIPLIPFGQAYFPGAVTTPVLALDFGMAIGTTTTAVATASTVTLTGPTPTGYTATATYASRFFYPGQRIIIPGAGNAAGTIPLITVVNATDRYAAPGFALAATGTITIANPALAVATNVGIGTSDQEYGVAAKPVVKAGAVRVYDPAQLTARNVTVTNGVGGSGAVTVRGFDIYEQPMSEVIAITASTTVPGKKAFAYISSVQVNAGGVTTGGVSIGTGTALGIPVRTDLTEFLTIWQNGIELPGSAGAAPAGVVFADQTLVATSATGDVRGTYLPGTTLPNGTARYTFFHAAPIAQAKVSNNIDFRGIIGVVQA
jgi:hypothetical protein